MALTKKHQQFFSSVTIEEVFRAFDFSNNNFKMSNVAGRIYLGQGAGRPSSKKVLFNKWPGLLPSRRKIHVHNFLLILSSQIPPPLLPERFWAPYPRTSPESRFRPSTKKMPLSNPNPPHCPPRHCRPPPRRRCRRHPVRLKPRWMILEKKRRS